MPNVLFKVGTLDLSTFIRVNPDQHFDPAQGDMIQPAFSDSPFFEGQQLTSLHVTNKELKVPLFLHPPAAPYTNDALNQLVQQVNQALRPVVDLGVTVNAEWRNAQATNSTFFTIQFGRFEPDFNFRITEKGWLAGLLHLWVLPYGHTATERIFAALPAPVSQSGMVVMPSAFFAGAGTIVGDVSPQMDVRLTVGSYLGDDGRIGIIAALPQAGYVPIIPVGSLIMPSQSLQGASGAWGSQALAVDFGNVGAGGQFTVALSPGSVYAGTNRILGLVRARQQPFALRAFDRTGVPCGPTAVASAMDGWQLVDYGTLRVAPWAATAMFTVQAYGNIPASASGMFNPPRNGPATWNQEHGPIFVIPNDTTLLELDWNSQLYVSDGFDGASGALPAFDALGNSWINTIVPNQFGAGKPGGSVMANGAGVIVNFPSWSFNLNSSASAPEGDSEVEAIFYIPTSITSVGTYIGVQIAGGNVGFNLGIQALFNASAISLFATQIPGATSLPGAYHLRAYSRGASHAFVALSGPTGALPSAVPVSFSRAQNPQSGKFFLNAIINQQTATIGIEAVRARSLASTGCQPRDILHLHQPLVQNTRANPSGIDRVDLQARQRGALQAPQLPLPSLGAGLFVASFPWDQGPANDLLNVDIRLRERFTYAR